MTREETKKALPLLNAYAEGKTIQYKSGEEWEDITSDGFEFNQFFKYRVKPETKYRPFKNADECWQEMQKHQPFGWVKVGGQYRLVVRVYKDVFQLDKADVALFNEVVQYCQFADGAPFGIKEEK